MTAALLAGGSWVVSQEPASVEQAGDPAVVERTQVELALVEAVVLDRRGRHVRGLPRSAFRLQVRGETVPIVTFDEIDIAGAAQALEALPPVPPQAPARTATGEVGEMSAEEAAAAEREAVRRRELEARLAGPRWFVMIFDGYNNVSPLRMSQVRRAAKKWIDSNMRPEDMVAIYEFNPYLSSVSGFSNDPDLLKRAIDNTRIFPGTDVGEEFISTKIEQVERIDRDFLESTLINAGRFGNDLLQAERDQYYKNVHNLADTLAAFDGTRAVMLFSGGFPLTRTRATMARGGFTPAFKEMFEALEARGIRVFSYDTGLEGGFTDASERTNYRLSLDELGLGSEWLDDLQIGPLSDSANAHREVLAVLGNESGGRFWGGRDYVAGLQAADDDLSHYYLVGYRPQDVPTRKDGEYRRIKLEVEGQGLRVVSRRGEFDRKAPPPTAPPIEIPDELLTPPVAGALDVFCHPLFFPGGGDRTLVVFPVNVAGPVPTLPVGRGLRALDVSVKVVASAGDETVESGERTFRMSLPEDKARALENGMQLREGMLLPAAALELTVSVQLNGLGRRGTWTRALEIPRRAGESFGLTELTLLDPSGSTPLVYDVFRKGQQVFGTVPPSALPDPLGDGQGRPPIYLDGGLSKTVPLLAQVQVVAPPPGGGEESPLRMDWELVPSDGGEAILPPVSYRRLQMVDDGRKLDVLVALDLAGVDPGEYTLRLTAQNRLTEGEDRRSMRITVAP